MSKAFSKRSSIERLESRTMLSASVKVMGFLLDFKIGNNTDIVFSENADGTISHDNVQWSALSQVDYFSILPTANPAAASSSPAATNSVSSNGKIQAISDSGYNPAIQLPALVADAKSHGVNVYVTVGGGDPNAIYDMDALVNSPSVWNKFASNLETFCKTYNLAGVDLDWEPTAQANFTVTKTQIENFGKLIQTIKSDDSDLKLTADALGDPVEISNAKGKDTGSAAYVLDAAAVKHLDDINVEAYPVGSEAESDTIMQNWSAYVSGGKDIDGNTVHGQIAQLQYGIDVNSDDTTNEPDGIIQAKVDTTLANKYGGLFLFDLDVFTSPSPYLSRIASEVATDGATVSLAATGSVSGTITAQHGAPVVGATVNMSLSNAGSSSASTLVMSTTTDSNGKYSFTVLPGTYVIQQILPAGDTQTSPHNSAGINVTVCANHTNSGNNFVDSVPQVPAAPTNLKAIAVQGNSIALTWTDTTAGLTGYQLDRATNSTFTQNLLTLSLPNSTAFGDTSLATGVTYYYRVRAVNSAGPSANSNTAFVALGVPPALNFATGFANETGLQLNGSAVVSGSALALTDTSKTFEDASVFSTVPVNVQNFTTNFDFQLSAGANIGHGFTFTIQNQSPTALGQSGGGLGYGNDYEPGAPVIGKGVAVKFDLYNNEGEGNNSTGLFTNGANPTLNSSNTNLTPSGINLHSGDKFNVQMTYDGTTLTVTIVDTVTSATATQHYKIDIPTTVGGSTALVGFTAGTGGLVANQSILDWTYTSPTPAPQVPPAPTALNALIVQGNSIALTWNESASGITGYQLDRATDPNFTQSLLTLSLPASETAFGDLFLSNITYYYRVRAVNVAGASANSNTAFATV